jgi:predicted PurR-regulated permease PerM
MSQKTPQTFLADTPSRAERIKQLCFLVWAVIGMVLLVVALGYVLGQIATALASVGLSALIVFILRIPTAWLERKKVPRWLGSIISYLTGLVILSLILLIFIPVIWQQIVGLITLVPGYISESTAAFNEFYHQYRYLLEDSNIQQVVSNTASELSGWAGALVTQSAQGVITLGTNVVTTVIVFAVALIVGFWVLMDLPTIGRELRVVIGPKYEEEVLFVVSSLSRAFGGYLRGVTVASVCTGVFATTGYYIIGLPYPVVLGLLTGLMNFIPYVGPWIAGGIAAIIGLFVSPLVTLLSILVTVIAQQITDNFITPHVMSTVVELHPAIVLVGVFAGGALGGFLGLIAAIPLLSAGKNIFVHYFEKRTGRTLVDEKGALFRGRSKLPGEGESLVVEESVNTEDNLETEKEQSEKQ